MPSERDKRPCGHVWRSNDFDCLECVANRVKRLVDALTEIRDGRFRYNMGDYETCAKNTARIALGEE